MNEEQFKGKWNIGKGKLKQKYADLKYAEGKSDERLGKIQEKSGESKKNDIRFVIYQKLKK
ncbi:general stress protein CsbD [uncultured Maribacter sp.]|uniref:CsbD family protein n=1 Tax=uncultured Maribacter sp. TaxID=431308 RepID=UPI0030D9823B|tara:strand:- start:260 stop:442 length:183 start_codon:yes stop_codon:yes gene_type:complete